MYIPVACLQPGSFTALYLPDPEKRKAARFTVLLFVVYWVSCG
jgi:hypothetical protein